MWTSKAEKKQQQRVIYMHSRFLNLVGFAAPTAMLNGVTENQA